MSQITPDTSSISFTAHYTGHVWYANALSEPAFHSWQGHLLYLALTPLEKLSAALTGGNLRLMLLQRHHLLDHRLEQAIEQHGISQVLEIAAGLSPRGWRFCQKYPHLRYVEADLPAMATRKSRLLQGLEKRSDQHGVTPLNIFSLKGSDTLEAVLDRHFDAKAPVAIITEGLVNYFTLETITPFWSRVQRALARRSGGVYLSDNYFLPEKVPYRKALQLLSRLLGQLSSSQVSFHFASEKAMQTHFKGLGFSTLRVHDPAQYPQPLPHPPLRGESLVRVLEAWSQ